MNLKKKISIIVTILLIILILLFATIIIINKIKLNKNDHYETYIGTIEKIDDNRINVSVSEVKEMGFSEDNESIELYDQAGNPVIKSELSVDDMIYIKEKVWSEELLRFEFYLREGRIINIEDRDDQSKYISMSYSAQKKCLFDKNDIKVIKNNNLDLIDYSDLEVGNKVYIINNNHEDADSRTGENGAVVFPEATDKLKLEDVELLQLLDK